MLVALTAAEGKALTAAEAPGVLEQADEGVAPMLVDADAKTGAEESPDDLDAKLNLIFGGGYGEPQL